MRVVVLTTSYPREPGDAAGRFIADGVERLRGRGLDVEVVSPADLPHFGLAYGSGIVGNLRRRPWLALLLPLFLLAFAGAAVRAARGACRGLRAGSCGGLVLWWRRRLFWPARRADSAREL